MPQESQASIGEWLRIIEISQSTDGLHAGMSEFRRATVDPAVILFGHLHGFLPEKKTATHRSLDPLFEQMVTNVLFGPRRFLMSVVESKPHITRLMNPLGRACLKE